MQECGFCSLCVVSTLAFQVLIRARKGGGVSDWADARVLPFFLMSFYARVVGASATHFLHQPFPFSHINRWVVTLFPFTLRPSINIGKRDKVGGGNERHIPPCPPIFYYRFFWWGDRVWASGGLCFSINNLVIIDGFFQGATGDLESVNYD